MGRLSEKHKNKGSHCGEGRIGQWSHKTPSHCLNSQRQTIRAK